MLPERFDLHYIDEEGRPAAAGRHPPGDLWLAGALHRRHHRALRRRVPVLAAPRSRRSSSRSPTAISRRPTELAGAAAGRGLRVEVDESSSRMQNKIRLAQEQKVPYMVVLGDREIEARTAVAADQGRGAAAGRAWDALADRLAAEAKERRAD